MDIKYEASPSKSIVIHISFGCARTIACNTLQTSFDAHVIIHVFINKFCCARVSLAMCPPWECSGVPYLLWI